MELVISGEINDWRVKEVAKFLNKCAASPDNSHTIIINSHGGDEGCGRAIAGMITTFHAICKTTSIITEGYGDIQSAAVIVFAAGKRRLLSKFATIMVHESTTEIEGNATAMKKNAKQMEADEKFWCDRMQDLTDTDSKIWLKLHEDETYLRPEEALKLNLATELI